MTLAVSQTSLQMEWMKQSLIKIKIVNFLLDFIVSCSREALDPFAMILQYPNLLHSAEYQKALYSLVL